MGASQHKGLVSTPRSSQQHYQAITPDSRESFPKRQLPFDPRSPTNDISRTPIVVDKTPSSLSGIDPRSPSEGITRTPMSYLLSKGIPENGHMEMEVEASPHLFGKVQAPLCKPEESEGDGDRLAAIKSLPCDIPDMDADDSLPLLENPCLPLNSVEPTPLQPKPQPLPKQLFPTTTTKPPVSTKPQPVPRPVGLVARDTNSPRTIVQTKQRRQVTKTMGHVRGTHASADKENMAI